MEPGFDGHSTRLKSSGAAFDRKAEQFSAEFKRPAVRRMESLSVGPKSEGENGRGCHNCQGAGLDGAQARNDAASDQGAREGWAHPERKRDSHVVTQLGIRNQ